MRERDARLRAVRVLQRVGHDKRIAVAIAADPRAHDQKRGNDRLAAKVARMSLIKIGIKPRDLVEKRIPVVGDAVVDLVLHLQLGQSSSLIPAVSFWLARRKRIAVWRINSIRANPSSPVWARSTSPRSRPSRRVSSLSGRSLSVEASIALRRKVQSSRL